MSKDLQRVLGFTGFFAAATVAMERSAVRFWDSLHGHKKNMRVANRFFSQRRKLSSIFVNLFLFST